MWLRHRRIGLSHFMARRNNILEGTGISRMHPRTRMLRMCMMMGIGSDMIPDAMTGITIWIIRGSTGISREDLAPGMSGISAAVGQAGSGLEGFTSAYLPMTSRMWTDGTGTEMTL